VELEESDRTDKKKDESRLLPMSSKVPKRKSAGASSRVSIDDYISRIRRSKVDSKDKTPRQSSVGIKREEDRNILNTNKF